MPPTPSAPALSGVDGAKADVHAWLASRPHVLAPDPVYFRIREITHDLGVSKVTVLRALAWLHAKGHIDYRAGNRGQMSSAHLTAATEV